MKVKELLHDAKQILRTNHEITRPDLDAYLIVAHVLNIASREALLRVEKQLITAEKIKLCVALIHKRLTNEPLAYIVQHKEFWDYNFFVNKSVLIPRPETELIIELVLRHHPKQKEVLKILDLGTGSGCIAITLLKLYTNARAVAIDVSPEALAVAGKNSTMLEVSNRIELIQSNWFANIMAQKFDIIVSNPPYIGIAELATLQPAVLHEPQIALTDNADGLAHYKTLLSQIKNYLHPKGLAIFEFGYGQLAHIVNIAHQHQLKILDVAKDLAGIERCLIITV